jgi:hypothetical protein
VLGGGVMAAMKIYRVDLVDESWFYVFAKSQDDAVEYVAVESELLYFDSYSIEDFKREYDPIVRQMADNEIIEIEDQDEKTVAEWLASCEAKHPGCWMSNTYED